MTLTQFSLQLLLSLALGSLIGLERQWHRRLIDLKTNALVSMGATLFMAACQTPGGMLEPIRMGAQIVVGVGFIGGGLLFRDGQQTRGINTAATLWCSAGVGLLCGMGRGTEAAIAAMMLVVSNTVLRDAARHLNLRMGPNDPLSETVTLEWRCNASDLPALRSQALALLAAQRADVKAVHESRPLGEACLLQVQAVFEHADAMKEIERLLGASDGWPTSSVSWRRG